MNGRMSGMRSLKTYEYEYGDAEPYLDHTSTSNNTSEPQSPLSSPYELSYMHDFSADMYPSPEHEAETPGVMTTTAAAAPPAKTRAKRKRENRYKDAPPSVLSRRRAQNRASQRAYRERKDQRIKDLERMLGEAQQRNETLSQAYAELHAEYVKLKTTQFEEEAARAHAAVASVASVASVSPYAAPAPSFDPATAGLANNDRLDLDLYVYPELGSYAL